MLDMETFGTAKDSCIIQLSAVQFNHDFHVLNTFNDVISPQSCIDAGLTLDLDTIMWWMTQSEEAKTQVVLQKQRSELKDSLKRFKQWLPKDTQVWGNGASFDLAILDTAYRKCGMTKPWAHWNERCYRTINALIPKDDPGRPAFEGVKHNAVHDCLHQIKQLKYVCEKLSISLP